MDDRGIIEAIARAETQVRREADRRVRAARAWHDDELTRYKQLRRALESEEPPVQGGPKAPAANPRPGGKGRVKRRRLSPASPAELADRRQRIYRLVEEAGEPVALGDVCSALSLSAHKVQIGLKGLIAEGRIKAVGSGSATRYACSSSSAERLSKQAPTQGPLEERIIAVLEDRSRATGEELAQALREPLQVVIEACGRLQGEERISMVSHNGRPAYVLAVRF